MARLTLKGDEDIDSILLLLFCFFISLHSFLDLFSLGLLGGTGMGGASALVFANRKSKVVV